MARPTKYDAARADRICAYLRQGNTRRAACGASGISEDSFARWLKQKAGFADAVKTAEFEAETAHVKHIADAAERNWQASAWWLERRRKDDWRKPEEQVQHSGPGGGAIETKTTYAPDLSRLSDEELRELDRLLHHASNPE